MPLNDEELSIVKRMAISDEELDKLKTPQEKRNENKTEVKNEAEKGLFRIDCLSSHSLHRDQFLFKPRIMSLLQAIKTEKKHWLSLENINILCIKTLDYLTQYKSKEEEYVKDLPITLRTLEEEEKINKDIADGKEYYSAI